MIRSLYVAAGIGQVIAERAYIAGALGGCQAEIGSASAARLEPLAFLKGRLTGYDFKCSGNCP